MAVEDSFFRDILDNLTDGIYFTDERRRITYWSRGAERLTGFPKEEVLGRSCMDNILMHVDRDGRTLCLGGCPLSRAMQDRKPRETEAYLRTKDGHRLPVLIKTTAVVDGGGKVRGAVEIFSSDASRKDLMDRIAQLERDALLDPLTGLSNRRHMEMNLRSRLEEFYRNGWRFGILYMDVDRFKDINDRYGHDAGDAVLRVVGRTLDANSRTFDQVARWGGEEFLALIVNAGLDRLVEIGDRFRMLVEHSRPPLKEDIRITISVGVAAVQDDDTVEKLVQRADQNLYAAKRAGRNRVCL